MVLVCLYSVYPLRMVLVLYNVYMSTKNGTGMYVCHLRMVLVCKYVTWEWYWYVCMSPENGTGMYVCHLRMVLVCMYVTWEWYWYVCMSPENGTGMYVCHLRMGLVCMYVTWEWYWYVCPFISVSFPPIAWRIASGAHVSHFLQP